MVKFLDDWFPQVVLCLLMQAFIIGGARVLDRIGPSQPLGPSAQLAL
ncbi:hypothetical protein KBY58_08240 [Cyanobium sp. HWJ4-Hawea]|nr:MULTISPECIES: hypothetical protein [unclassified Cyanobium]MCP9774912.1 hypothetical protein [Cyanobium sp. WAJ14-Wanaka]MCP9809421.1 hypothetical protein [Cyanobium sp. HWJ4-Hawea]